MSTLLPSPSQGLDCVRALNAPACHHVRHRLASLMSPLWEWPFVAGSGHTAWAKAPFSSRLAALMPLCSWWDNGKLPVCLPSSVSRISSNVPAASALCTFRSKEVLLFQPLLS